jgi:hypothetical protein
MGKQSGKEGVLINFFPSNLYIQRDFSSYMLVQVMH